MQAAANTVVRLAFTLKDGAGNLVDEKSDHDALAYIHGHGYLPPGFECALEGMGPGETKNVRIAAADAFGDRDETRVEKLGRHRVGGKNFKGKKGDVLRFQTPEGPLVATVLAVTQVSVTVDFNHPLAGKDLDCTFRVLDVRAATPAELEHGHPHEDGDAHCHEHDGKDQGAGQAIQ